jgi:hypothetical protein
MKSAAITILILLVCGCNRSASLMPSRSGLKWTYSIRTPFSVSIDEARISGTTPVGDSLGFVLSTPVGETLMAWQQSQLVVGRAGGTGFHPPVPIYDSNLGEGKVQWMGQMIVSGTIRKAHAELRQRRERLDSAGKSFDCVKTDVMIATPEGKVDLTTWLSPGVGIVRQEQRNNGKFVVRIEWINGPRTQS